MKLVVKIQSISESGCELSVNDKFLLVKRVYRNHVAFWVLENTDIESVDLAEVLQYVYDNSWTLGE